jgi:hypothetical protein
MKSNIYGVNCRQKQKYSDYEKPGLKKVVFS